MADITNMNVFFIIFPFISFYVSSAIQRDGCIDLIISIGGFQIKWT